MKAMGLNKSDRARMFNSMKNCHNYRGYSLVYLDVDGLDLDLFLRARRDEDLRVATLDTRTELRSGTISGALNLS